MITTENHMQSRNGLVSVQSAHDVAETARRFQDAAEKAGLAIFSDIDHGQNAVEAGLALKPTRLLIFGNPRGGTPLMQANRSAAIDLPFKALVWEDDDGAVWLTYNDPRWLAARHEIGSGADATISAIDAGMKTLTLVATAP
jgi:uncharacterized protein (DUF302 family)